MWQPTIYILGNPGVFQSALEGLQAIFSPPSGDPNAWAGGSGSGFAIGTIIKIGFMVGLLALAGRGLINQRYEWHNLAIGLLVYVALFIPTTDVIVYDLYSGTSFEVNNIPIGVAYPAGFASEASYYLMNVMDTVNQDPRNSAPPIDMSTGGFEAPLMTVMALRGLPAEFQHYNPGFFHNIVNFTKNCDASGTTFNLSNDIEHQPQIMTTLLSSSTYNANARTAIYDDSFPFGSNNIGTMSCANAATFLTSEWTTFATNTTNGPVTEEPVINYTSATPGQEYTIYPLSFILGTQIPQAGMASLTGSTAGGPGTAIPLDTVESEINALIPNCSGAGDGETCADGSLAINFMKNQISGCLATAGSQLYRQSGVPSPTVALPGFCLDMSNALAVQQEKNAGMASVFEANVVPLMTILQFLFFALAPLVALMVAFMGSSGNHGVYSKYMLFGIWTESFLPVAALINDYSQFQVQNVLNQQMTAGTGTAISNMSDFINIGSVFSHVQLALSSANMMIVAVPVLTFSILTGSYYAMTKLGGMISAESSMTPEATAQVQPPKFNEGAVGYALSSAGDGAHSIAASSAMVDSGVSFDQSSLMAATSAASVAAVGSAQQSLNTSQSAVRSSLANLTHSNQNSQALSDKRMASLSNNVSEMETTESGISQLLSATDGRAAVAVQKGEVGAGLDTALAAAKVQYGHNLSSEEKAQVTRGWELGRKYASAKRNALDISQSITTGDTQTSTAASSLSQAISESATNTGALVNAYGVSASVTKSAQQSDTQGAQQNISSGAAYKRFIENHKGTSGLAALNGYLSSIEKSNPSAYLAGKKVADAMPSSVSGLQRKFIEANAAMGAAVSMGNRVGASPSQIQAASNAASGYAALIDATNESSSTNVPQQASAMVSSQKSSVEKGGAPSANGSDSVPGAQLPPTSDFSSIGYNATQTVGISPSDFQQDIAPLKSRYDAIKGATEQTQGGMAAYAAGGTSSNAKGLHEYVYALKAAAQLKTPAARAQAIMAAMQNTPMAKTAAGQELINSQQVQALAESPAAIDKVANKVALINPKNLAENPSGTQNPLVNFLTSTFKGETFSAVASTALIVGGSVAAHSATQKLLRGAPDSGKPTLPPGHDSPRVPPRDANSSPKSASSNSSTSEAGQSQGDASLESASDGEVNINTVNNAVNQSVRSQTSSLVNDLDDILPKSPEATVEDAFDAEVR